MKNENVQVTAIFCSKKHFIVLFETVHLSNARFMFPRCVCFRNNTTHLPGSLVWFYRPFSHG